MADTRCPWSLGDTLLEAYHDDEWGRPVGDDRRLFEKVSLEGFQSGLSWRTILVKRPRFRRVFHGFDLARVARFTEKDVERLLEDETIVRHRGKIEAVVNNAGKLADIADEFGSFASFCWKFEPDDADRPPDLSWDHIQTITETKDSKAMSKELKKRGFKFVGPTTMYAFQQSVGIVNDHVEGCPARAACEKERKAFKRP